MFIPQSLRGYLWLLFYTLAIVVYIYIPAFDGNSGGPTCAGGFMPIYINDCDSGVRDVDCGSNEGCLSYLLAKCSQKMTAGDYTSCVKSTVSRCQAQGNLRSFDALTIMGCANAGGYIRK